MRNSKWIYILVLFMVIPNMVFGEIIMPEHKPISVFDDLDSLYNKLASGLVRTKGGEGSEFAVNYLFNMASVIAEYKFNELEIANPKLKKITRFNLDILKVDSNKTPENREEVSSNDVPATESHIIPAAPKVATSLKLTSSVKDKSVVLKYRRGTLEGSSNYLVMSNEIKFSVNKSFDSVRGQVDYNYTAKEITATASKSVTANLNLTVSAKNNMGSNEKYTGVSLAYRF